MPVSHYAPACCWVRSAFLDGLIGIASPLSGPLSQPTIACLAKHHHMFTAPLSFLRLPSYWNQVFPGVGFGSQPPAASVPGTGQMMESGWLQQMLLVPCPHPLGKPGSVGSPGLWSVLRANDPGGSPLPVSLSWSRATLRLAECSCPEAVVGLGPSGSSENLLINGAFWLPSFSHLTLLSYGCFLGSHFNSTLQLKNLFLLTSTRVLKLPGKGHLGNHDQKFMSCLLPLCKVKTNNRSKTSKYQQQ